MKTHILKCWPEPFYDLGEGKTFEFRRDDGRGFQVGDVLVLREWDINATPCECAVGFDCWCLWTGEEQRRRVTYILRGPDFDVPAGFVVMAIVEAR